MFTGIIETIGTLIHISAQENNLHLTIESPISAELKIDQSVAHNGVCLTVTGIKNNTHTVTAVKETLLKSTLAKLKIADSINLERCLKIGDRLDGHMVQGHVDGTATVISIVDEGGSYIFTFRTDIEFENLIVEKGSICINGISFTLIDVQQIEFSIAVIPYTWQHTNIQYLKIDDDVNIEFDILGKYVSKILDNKK